MFKQILFVHWRALRLALLPLTLAAFALPLASVQGRIAIPESRGVLAQGAGLLVTLQSWLAFYPALAAIIGIAAALGVWAWDGQAKHIYALSLPVTRQKYILNKLSTGAALVALPSLALWAGSLLATASIEIPYGLHAYPTAVAVRFLFASLIAYVAVFALASWSGKSAVVGVSVIAAMLLFADLATSVAAATMVPELTGVSPMAWVIESLFHVPGPFGVFSGNWALIDV